MPHRLKRRGRGNLPAGVRTRWHRGALLRAHARPSHPALCPATCGRPAPSCPGPDAPIHLWRLPKWLRQAEKTGTCQLRPLPSSGGTSSTDSSPAELAAAMLTVALRSASCSASASCIVMLEAGAGGAERARQAAAGGQARATCRPTRTPAAWRLWAATGRRRAGSRGMPCRVPASSPNQPADHCCRHCNTWNRGAAAHQVVELHQARGDGVVQHRRQRRFAAGVKQVELADAHRRVVEHPLAQIAVVICKPEVSGDGAEWHKGGATRGRCLVGAARLRTPAVGAARRAGAARRRACGRPCRLAATACGAHISTRAARSWAAVQDRRRKRATHFWRLRRWPPQRCPPPWVLLRRRLLCVSAAACAPAAAPAAPAATAAAAPLLWRLQRWCRGACRGAARRACAAQRRALRRRLSVTARCGADSAQRTREQGSGARLKGRSSALATWRVGRRFSGGGWRHDSRLQLHCAHRHDLQRQQQQQ